MACDLFQSRLAALVYDDLSSEDRAAVQAHLAICSACSRSLARLSATRAILADAAPSMPRAPRLVVLAPRRAAPAWASFAAGIVAAALVGTGAYALGSRHRTAAPPEISAPMAAAFDADRAREIARDETRRQLEAMGAQVPVPATSAGGVTRADLRAELAGFEQRLQRERAQDVGFVLDQIAASETRSRDRIGDTRKALRYVALSNNPGLGEY